MPKKKQHVFIKMETFENKTAALTGMRAFDDFGHQFSFNSVLKRAANPTDLHQCRRKLGDGKVCKLRAEVSSTAAGVNVSFFWQGGEKVSCKDENSLKRKLKFDPQIAEKIVSLREGSETGAPFRSNLVVAATASKALGHLLKPNQQLGSKAVSNLYGRNKAPNPGTAEILLRVQDLKNENPDLIIRIFKGPELDYSPGSPEQLTSTFLKSSGLEVSDSDKFLIFLCHKGLLQRVLCIESGLLPLSADFVHKLNGGQVGVYTLTTADLKRKQLPLAFVLSPVENRGGYFYAFSCLQSSLSELSGKGINFAFFNSLVIDGIAPTSISWMAKSILNVDKRDCLFHAAQNGRKKLGSEYGTIVRQGLLHLARSPLSENALRKLFVEFKGMALAYIRQHKKAAFSSWCNTYLPDGNLSGFFSYQMDVQPFKAGPLHCVTEASHGALRQRVMDVLPKQPRIDTLLRYLAVNELQGLAEAADTFTWSFKPANDMWRETQNLQPPQEHACLSAGKKLNFFIFQRYKSASIHALGSSTDAHVDFKMALHSQGLTLTDALIMFIDGQPELLEKVFDPAKARGVIFRSFIAAMDNHAVVGYEVGREGWMTCSCGVFWRLSGCPHILFVMEHLGMPLDTSEKSWARHHPEGRLKRSRQEVAFDKPFARGSVNIFGRTYAPLSVPIFPSETGKVFPLCHLDIFTCLPPKSIVLDHFNILTNPAPMKSSHISGRSSLKPHKPTRMTSKSVTQTVESMPVETEPFSDRIRIFHNKLKDFGYKVKEDVPGDGDCFFHAVRKCVQDQRPWMPPHLLTPKRMRQEIAEALSKGDVKTQVHDFMGIHGEPGEEEFEKKYKAHLEDIKGSLWADHIMSLAVSKLYAINLKVVHDNGHIDKIDAESEALPSIGIIRGIIRANKDVVPAPVSVTLGNLEHTHFVVIEEVNRGEQTTFGRGKRKPKRKIKYGFDV